MSLSEEFQVKIAVILRQERNQYLLSPYSLTPDCALIEIADQIDVYFASRIAFFFALSEFYPKNNNHNNRVNLKELRSHRTLLFFFHS